MKKAEIMIHAIRIGELNNRKELVDLTGDKRNAFIQTRNLLMALDILVCPLKTHWRQT